MKNNIDQIKVQSLTDIQINVLRKDNYSFFRDVETFKIWQLKKMYYFVTEILRKELHFETMYTFPNKQSGFRSPYNTTPQKRDISVHIVKDFDISGIKRLLESMPEEVHCSFRMSEVVHIKSTDVTTLRFCFIFKQEHKDVKSRLGNIIKEIEAIIIEQGCSIR